jgi:16S rRNA (guanine(966)-N(2))-methyltransferase RsmD
MRIIGGKFKGRRFYPPANKWPTRPTTDFAKEGLYNILLNRFDFSEISMLDLFGGTGNHCFESISRGCTNATYVDKFFPAVRFVREISEALDIQDKITILKDDVFRFVSTCKDTYSYVFAGPPYDLTRLDQLPDLIFSHQILTDDGLFVLEHNAHHVFEDHHHFLEMRKYGGTFFSFFTSKTDNAD